MTKAQTTFTAARPEIAELLRTAKNLSEQVSAQRRMSPQENQLRQVVVALIAVLQSYVSELLEEKADELGDSWGDLSELQQRYVVVQARRRIGMMLEGCKESELAKPQKVASLRSAILECAEWQSTPSSLARSAYRVKLDGFLQDNGGNTLDRTISHYGKCGMTFFDWLAKHYPAFRGVGDALNIIIATRNDVAHGSFERRVTMRDTRLHRVLIYRMIAKIELYMETEKATPRALNVLADTTDPALPKDN